MVHEVIVKKLPKKFEPTADMHPFFMTRQEKMTLTQQGVPLPSTVGIRCMGYFAYSGTDDGDIALAALKYGLQTAQFRLSDAACIDFPPLYTDNKAAFIAAANDALAESESPCSLTAVEFAYVDYCIHDGSLGKTSQRYSGFVMGQSSIRKIAVHTPQGIPGEWQCVCGAYNAPSKKCKECGIKKPNIML